MRSKKVILGIVITAILLVGLGIYAVIDYNRILTPLEALELGEKRYLQFLWMLDEAFNDKSEYIVNDKKLDDKDKPFVCDTKKKLCVVKDFKELFHNYFINAISLDKVYSDGLSYKRYVINGEDYSFKDAMSCGFQSMSVKQTLQVNSIERGVISYVIDYENNDTSSKIRNYKKEFILKYENRQWKIAKAYYSDSCRMDYNIE